MPDNLGLYVLLVVALGIGFLLGRRERSQTKEKFTFREYFIGLNHLLNNREDLAIDTFIERIAVDETTFETHLAFGSLVRRRGDVEKATRIHQTLLSHPELSAEHCAQAELELARDYLSAGLLGRAESLLSEIARKSTDRQPLAMRLLAEVYERERDWQRAAEVAEVLGRTDSRWQMRLAYYYCELAEIALLAHDYPQSQEHLEAAARADTNCPRAYLMGARLDLARGRLKDVKKKCRRFIKLVPRLAGETLEMYQTSAQELGKPDDYLAYLRQCGDIGGDVRVVLAQFEQLVQSDTEAVAYAYLVDQLSSQDSLAGYVALLEPLNGKTLDSHQVAKVRDHTRQLLGKQFDFRCGSCGVGSRQLQWQCPGCRQWGQAVPAAVPASTPASVPASSARR